jgi:hypothetical protein
MMAQLIVPIYAQEDFKEPQRQTLDGASVVSQEYSDLFYVYGRYSETDKQTITEIVINNDFITKDCYFLELSICEEGKKEEVFSFTYSYDSRCAKITGLDTEKRYILSASGDSYPDVYAFSGYFVLHEIGMELSVEYYIVSNHYQQSKLIKNEIESLYRAKSILAEKNRLYNCYSSSDNSLDTSRIPEEEREEVIRLNSIVSYASGRSISTETEFNGSFYQANLIYDDDTTYGWISSDEDEDYYKVMFDAVGYANFWLGNIPSGKDYDLFLYDSDGELLSTGNSLSNQEQIYNYSVQANTWYYLVVISADGSYDQTNPYIIRAKNYPSANADSHEPNNTFSTATEIYLGSPVTDSNIHIADDEDYYEFEIVAGDTLNVLLYGIPTNCNYDIKLYNSQHSCMATSAHAGASSELISLEVPTSGTYYVKVYSVSGFSTNNYVLSMSANYPAPILDNYEPNDTLSTATSIQSTSSIQASISTGDDTDYFDFSIDIARRVEITLSNIPSGCDYNLQLLDNEGDLICQSNNGFNNSESLIHNLPSGTYYIKVYTVYGFSNSVYTLATTSGAVIENSEFSALIVDVVTPNNVDVDYNAIRPTFDKWPAGPISRYYGELDSTREAELDDILDDVDDIANPNLFPPAGEYLTHYLDKTGSEKSINVSALNGGDSSATNNLHMVVNLALNAAEQFLSSGNGTITFCNKDDPTFVGLETTFLSNYFLAIGRYTVGVKVTVNRNGTMYSAQIVYHVYDVYDFDRQGNTPFYNGRTYSDMWELQYGGYARGFLIHGYATYFVSWELGERVGTGAYLQCIS